MNKKVLEKVESLVTPIITSLGLLFVDVDYKLIHSTPTLTIYIDKNTGGVTLNDCEKVSKAVDILLDELDPTEGAFYNLNVSSPGLDRPLKREIDFKRNINKEVEVKFYSSNEYGKKLIVGTLLSYTDDSFTLISGETSININKKDVAQIVPVITF